MAHFGTMTHLTHSAYLTITRMAIVQMTRGITSYMVTPVVLLGLLLVVLSGTVQPTLAGIASSSPAPPYPDGFNNGIFGPDTIWVRYEMGGIWMPFASYFVRLPTMGIPVASLSGPLIPPGKDPGFTLGGENGLQLEGNLGIYGYDPKAPNPTSFTITVTDGFSTLSKVVTVNFTYGQAITWQSNFLVSSRGAAVNNIYGGWANVSITPSGPLIISGTQFKASPATIAANYSGAYGEYTATFTYNDIKSSVQPTKFYIIQEREAIVALDWAQTLYTNLVPLTQVGKLRYWSETGISTCAFPPDQDQFIISSDGHISVRKPLIVVTDAPLIVTVTSWSGMVTNVTFRYTVKAGRTLDASVLNFAQNGLIDNQHRGQLIGQVSATGFMPTTWYLTNRNSEAWGARGMNLFLINSTGYIYSPSDAKIPARMHKVTITASDGPNLATRTFLVNVTWFQGGPVYYVGRNMSKIYGANGFEHLHDAMQKTVQQSMPDNLMGWTVNIAYDADPNYYADDNGILQQDWGMRFGWYGPGVIQAMDPTKPRPRVGGNIYKSVGGNDMNDKGFFNLADGDMIIRGLEISHCNGGGATEDGMTGGISCIRKNAYTWGDLTVEDCFIHQNDNGIEGGNGPFDIYVRNSVIASSGQEYVSSGATHGNYIGGNSYVEVTNNLYYNSLDGHNLKIRAYSGLIRGNRFYDAERGGASAQLDIPNGGLFVIENNEFHKGPNAQSYPVVLFAAETTQGGRPHSLLFRNNIVSVSTINRQRFGSGVGVSLCRINPFQYPLGNFTIVNNSFYIWDPSLEMTVAHLGSGDPQAQGGAPPPWSEINSTLLVEPPRLDFTDPSVIYGKHSPATRVTWLLRATDGAGNFPNFPLGMQIDPGKDDIRVPITTKPGSYITTAVANGSLVWENARSPANTALVNPFINGTTWSIVPNVVSGDGTHNLKLAPFTRYAINAKTGVLTLNESLSNVTVGLDMIVLEAKVTSGTYAGVSVWWRFYISLIAKEDGALPPRRQYPTGEVGPLPFLPDVNSLASDLPADNDASSSTSINGDGSSGANDGDTSINGGVPLTGHVFSLIAFLLVAPLIRY